MSTPIAAPVAPQTEALAGDHAPAAAGLPAAVPKVRERWARRGSVALAILATVAVVFALDWAQSLFISLLLGILLAYTLNPLVIWLERLGIPRVLGTSSVMAVSYTHLDVYKRQTVHRLLHSPPIWASHLKVVLIESLISWIDHRAASKGAALAFYLSLIHI